MVKYTFKLKESYRPDLTQKIKDKKQYAGRYLIYSIFKVYYFTIRKRDIIWFRHKLGTKTFLNPYKKFWDKRTYRLPYVYWGKRNHPLTRLWVVIPNNYPLGMNKIIPEVNLINQHVKLFGRNFRSKDITKNLFGCKDKFNLLIIN